MAMAFIWTGMVFLSVLFGLFNGTMGDVSAAALEGAGAAVTLSLSMLGVICLWNGIMEVCRRGGIASALARVMRPWLARLFPENRKNEPAMEALSANVSANLLGLGNAATPLGIQAAGAMKKGTIATNDLCTLVVLNTASIQLVPATIAGIRAAAGAVQPFDVLPAIWVTSLTSLTVGLILAKSVARKSQGEKANG